ncbi:deoxyribonuclease V [Actinoplanes tereljensis]|uniref:Endonuclease V n=1 Tax=Paractinoplanes tereljensis TaxID=571912 RepID=A0A919NJX6_9ACTN|nr:endonuclease V [Actinoplanes tereljensis]GIF20080.1 endonuclease V [Actinoplanes tereljensis]
MNPVPFELPADAADGERIQDELRKRLILPTGRAGPPATVTGLDISYAVGSRHAVAAAVTIGVDDLKGREVAVAEGDISFPYVPGLLAFRELPLLLAAIAKLKVSPEVLVCDGYGIAHPRRFGLASHLGVLLDRPSFGVAKNDFIGTHDEPGPRRGEWSALTENGELLGRAVRTQSNVKPVYVSVGHRISLADATDLAIALSPKFRIPEPTRQADIISREILRDSRHGLD